MDSKAIIEKALKGQDYSADIKDFTDEQKTQLSLDIRNAADAGAKEELTKIEARRAELKRLDEKPPVLPPEDKKPPIPPADNTMKQFRDEQVLKAKKKFYSQFKVSDEDKAKLETEFAKLDSGKIDADLILGDLKRAYAVVNADALIDTSNRFNKGMSDADRLAAEMANQSGINDPKNDKFSGEAKKLFLEWQKAGFVGPNYTLESAQRVISGGTSRTLN